MRPQTRQPQTRQLRPTPAASRIRIAVRAAVLSALSVPAAGGWCTAQPLVFLDAAFDGDVVAGKTVDGLDFVFAAAVSPEGRNVYACAGNGGLVSSDNAVAVFARRVDGRLRFVEALFDDDDFNDPGTADGLFGCRDVVVSPDGKHVYTAAGSEGKIGIFLRDSLTGGLTFSSVVEDGVGLVDSLAGVQAIALSPDGAFLFAVGSIDDAVAAFTRDAVTGALVFEDVERQGLGGVAGLDRPSAVAVSPDGRYVYTAAGSNENSSGSDALAVFEWDAGMGDLVFVAAYFEGGSQGASTIDGLDRVSSVTVSPDGKHVYATGGVDLQGDADWIAVFARSAATGALTWVSSIDHSTTALCDTDITFGFETYAVVSPDGERLLVTSPAAALVEFSRDTASGALTLAGAECFFDALLQGIDQGTNLPRKPGLDPRGRFVYIPGNASNALAVFATGVVFADGFESGDTAGWSSVLP